MPLPRPLLEGLLEVTLVQTGIQCNHAVPPLACHLAAHERERAETAVSLLERILLAYQECLPSHREASHEAVAIRMYLF